MTNHTPGPWAYRVDPDLDDNITGPNAEQIARVYATDTEAGMANAALIAAAPELLEALKAVLPHLNGKRVNMPGGLPKASYEKLDDLIGRTVAAIAKAEGRN